MIMDRVAGAPISWGVCEVPGWGYQLAPEQVLPEMREIGLVATEFGPEGFLPADPEASANPGHVVVGPTYWTLWPLTLWSLRAVVEPFSTVTLATLS